MEPGVERGEETERLFFTPLVVFSSHLDEKNTLPWPTVPSRTSPGNDGWLTCTRSSSANTASLRAGHAVA